MTETTGESSSVLGGEWPRFRYWAHWTNLVGRLLVCAWLFGLALVIMPDNTFALVMSLVVVAPGLIAVISYFLPWSVELHPHGLRFHTEWEFLGVNDRVPYMAIGKLRRTLLGGVEIRYRGRTFGDEKWAEKRRTIYLRDADAFLLALRTRAAFSRGTGPIVA